MLEDIDVLLRRQDELLDSVCGMLGSIKLEHLVHLPALDFHKIPSILSTRYQLFLLQVVLHHILTYLTSVYLYFQGKPEERTFQSDSCSRKQERHCRKTRCQETAVQKSTSAI